MEKIRMTHQCGNILSQKNTLLPHHNVADHRLCKALVQLRQQFALGAPVNLRQPRSSPKNSDFSTSLHHHLQKPVF